MKILITGSRSITDKEKVFKILEEELDVENDEIIQGGATGVDTLARRFAEANGMICTTILPCDKTKKQDYLYRDVEMIALSDRVIAIWDGKSTGTKFTTDYAQKRNKPIKIITVTK